MKLIKFLFAFLLLSVFSFELKAQANQTLLLRNSNNKLFRYGYEGILTTRDSGYHTIATFPIALNEAGMLEAQVIGKDSLWNSCAGSLIVRYEKDSLAALTLLSPTNVLAVATSEGISGANFAFDTLSNNVILKVRGDTATVVNWIANVRWINKK